MPVAFSVKVSGDSACRGVAADVARRYFELAGVSATQVEIFGTTVAGVIDAIADGEREIDLSVSQVGLMFEVEVSCGGRREHRRLPSGAS